MLLTPQQTSSSRSTCKRRIFREGRTPDAARPAPFAAQPARPTPMASSAAWTGVRESALRRGARRPDRGRRRRHLVAGQRAGRARSSACRPRDLGRPLQDLELSYRPVELRTHIEPAHAERRAVRDARTSSAAGRRRARVPRDPGHPARWTPATGCSASRVTFLDVTVQRQLQSELERLQPRARDRLRGAAVHQRGAGDHQRGAAVHHRGAGDHQRGAAVHQRRAGDHERGAPVHQRGAADDQRRAAPAHARARSGQHVPGVHPHQHGLRGRGRRSLAGGPGLERKAPELWGLRADEAEGENLLGLDIGLPLEKLSGALRDVLNDGESRVELRVDATNRRGHPIDCRIVALPLSVDGQDVSAPSC